MDSAFIEITLLLAVTVGAAFLVRLLRQPLIVAYILAGIVGGPMLLGLFDGDHELYQTFAQFGVVLLLFIIGLNLNFRHLKAIGRVSLMTGLGQVIFTAGLGTLILWAINLPLMAAAYLAVAITFSSTIIIMKLLADKKDSDTIYGRYTIGLMLVQDIIAVLMIIALGITHGSLEPSAGDPIWLVIKLIGAAVALVLISKYVLPRVLDKIAGSGELLFLFTIAWCFSIASALYALGLSLEVGAVASGIALSSSPYQLEIGSRVKPLRDFFLILFFIVLGSELGLSSFMETAIPAVLLSLFILVGNPFILYLIFRSQKFTRRNSFLAGLTAAQVSEFGFVLLLVGQQAGYIGGRELAIFTAVAVLTIFVSSYLITYNEQIYRWLLPFFKLLGPDRHRQTERPPQVHDAWLIGYHRIGSKVAEALKTLKVDFAVIDFDPAAVAALRRARVKFYFGDIADLEFLENLPLAQSKFIIMTAPAVDDQINLIKFVRRRGSQSLIIANAYQKADAAALYTQGANYVMMPHLLGGQWIADVLRLKKINRQSLRRLKTEQGLLA